MPAEDTSLEPAVDHKKKPASRRRRMAVKGRKALAFLLKQTRILLLLMRHSQAPWYSRVIAACAVAYVLSPIQLIPTFIPVIGQLDDLFVLAVGMYLIRKFTPADILSECELRAGSAIRRRRMVSDGCDLDATEPVSISAA
jgi:uncharacterized membrane protein YkvA (DUF1232 family)